jgi:mRNA interferase MazF
VRRGEIRWYTFAAPDKRRPVLLLTRTNVIDTLNEIIVEGSRRRCCSRMRMGCPRPAR